MTSCRYYAVMNANIETKKGKAMAIQDSDEKDKQQGHPITREAIERLRQLRKKILQQHNGQLFEDSAELIHQMREERTQYLMELFAGDTPNAETNNP